MQKVFENGSEGDNRGILIVISEELIEFYYYKQFLYHRNWVKEETKKRIENSQEDLTEDEIADNTFYWIDKQNWINHKTQMLDRPDNWHNHMSRKRWFTSEMAKFMNENTPPY